MKASSGFASESHEAVVLQNELTIRALEIIIWSLRCHGDRCSM